MNFLKKKIKGHKRGGPESDEVEAAIYAKQLAEGQQPQQPLEAKERTGEEWRFFEQLTQRVQDTVHKTQTTLSKIKESSAITELTRPDYYLEPTAAPPEPASPARSWVNFEESEGAEAVGPSAGPSEPSKEPVGDLVKDLVSEPEVAPVGESVSSPPEAQSAADEDQARKLLEEFGFGFEEPPAPPPPVAPNLDLLSGFGVEEPEPSEALHVDLSDPFDTSFVDTLATSTEPDPFDTSFVDSCVAAKEAPPTDTFNGSEASPEMSNPFLTDVSATTGESLFGTGDTGDVTPDVPNFFSSSRRSSTNPFDNLEDDLALFQATLVGAAEADATQREASDLLQDIAATFPCESEDITCQPSNGDPFKCSESEQQQQQPAPDLFAGELEAAAAAVPDAFQVAFGKASFDRGLSPDKCGLSGGAFEDTSPEETAGGSPAEPVGSFDPFSDLSRESQEPIPAALASITPQREDVSPFDIGHSDDKQEPPAATNGKPELFADFATNEMPPASAECGFFGKDSGATSTVIASDDPFYSASITSPPAPCSDDPFGSSGMPAPPRTTGDDIFGTSSLSGSIATGSDMFQTTDVTAAKSVVSDGHDLFDTSDTADPAPTLTNGFSTTSAPAMPASDDPFQTSSTAAPAVASDTSLFDTSDIISATGGTSDDPFSASNIDALAHPPGADPFDTSNIQLEPAKNAVPFTDTAAFEAFAAKFEQAIEKFEDTTLAPAFDDLDQQSAQEDGDDAGFDSMDIFDPFAPKAPPPPKASPRVPVKEASQDSFDDDDAGPDLSVVIRPKMREATAPDVASLEPPPKLQPPPKSPVRSRFNPFDRGAAIRDEPVVDEVGPTPVLGDAAAMQRESAESPSTPLFDEDTSQPLEEFRPKFEGDGWEMMLRHPNKKKITGNRYWKKVFVRMTEQNILYLHNSREDADPFQEVPLQACYSLSEMGAQQFDAYGKIFTVKLQYVFYRERVGVRPGQIHKVMQGQITSVGQFAKLGLPLEHAPQVSQLLKLGTQSCEDLKSFIMVVEDALFRLQIHRDRALTYKTEEIQVTVQDEFIVEQDKTGHVWKQKARVRVFFLAFISGMPDIEVGINDLTRQGKEVVGRYDIMPVVTEEWIRLENCEFHSCVLQEEFENNRIIKLHPPDACLFEMMRFRIRPPKARELPLQLKVVMRVSPRHVELRADVLVPGYHSRKHGQVPCEDVQIRFPIPECWVYLFRVEKHFRYGALKSAARRPGKIKGLERIMGTAQPLETSLIEVSTGQAKYEHAYKAVVWRIPRLPKEGQGAYTSQLFLLRLDLTSFDQIPSSFDQHVFVEFTMPATSVSHTTVRSISVSNENPPEKYVRYLSKHEYRVEIELQTGEVPPSETEISSLAAVAQQAGPYEPPVTATAAAAAAAATTSDDSD
uniref:Putative stoned b synaptic vesicle bioproteinsis protein n=1 Tax=Hyalomma excavatum TaxID=257692 RepID=A0A131XGZ6_9ACAR